MGRFRGLWSQKAPDLAVDLGTRNLLISNNQRILYNNHYEDHKPLSNGVVCNIEVCTKILHTALKKLNFSYFRKPRLLLTTPLDISDFEKEAFERVARQAGAAGVQLMSDSLADAAGLVPNFFKKRGVLVIDIGAGISEIVLFSQGGVVRNNSIRIGGVDFENTLAQFIRTKYCYDIGAQTTLKLLDIMAHQRNEAFLEPIEIKGFNIAQGLPNRMFIEMRELDPCLDALFLRIIEVLHKVLEDIPADLNGDILDEGIYLTGGASQFPRLHELITKKLGIKTNLDPQALLGVARGEIFFLQNPSLL